jgi:hypothetical protein
VRVNTWEFPVYSSEHTGATLHAAASKYSYSTPKGYCENSTDLLNLYSTFTKNTLTVLDDEFVISHKFASIHIEFQNYIGMKLKDIGIRRKIK